MCSLWYEINVKWTEKKPKNSFKKLRIKNFLQQELKSCNYHASLKLNNKNKAKN